MTVLAECPICRKKQSLRNKVCSCGEILDKAKRSRRVKFWIAYRLPNGKLRRESIGYSLEEARDAEGKRRSQKREGHIFEALPETKMSFRELADWYLGLEKVKALASFWRIELALRKFCSVFGDTMVEKIRPADLENYQAKRQAEGLADNTIDHEIGSAKSMVFKAFDNDLVGANTVKTFKRVKKMLKRHANARDQTLGREQFDALVRHSPPHLRAILAMGYLTGMREGEILNLTWDRIDLHKRIIRLEALDTKDRESRKIPMCTDLIQILRDEIGNPLLEAGKKNYVFKYKDRPIKSIRTAVRTACKKAGIKYGRFTKGGFVFHDLRHTFNTNMRKAGVPESVIMEITGHSTREMFDRYNHVDDGDMRKAVDQLRSFLGNVHQDVHQPDRQAAQK